MTDHATIWKTLQQHLPRSEWVPVADILAIVRTRLPLDREDLEHRGSHSGPLRWESNVRHVLRSKARAGRIRKRKTEIGR